MILKHMNILKILDNLHNINVYLFKGNDFIKNKTNINEIFNNGNDLTIFVKINKISMIFKELIIYF